MTIQQAEKKANYYNKLAKHPKIAYEAVGQNDDCRVIMTYDGEYAGVAAY